MDSIRTDFNNNNNNNNNNDDDDKVKHRLTALSINQAIEEAGKTQQPN